MTRKKSSRSFDGFEWPLVVPVVLLLAFFAWTWSASKGSEPTNGGANGTVKSEENKTGLSSRVRSRDQVDADLSDEEFIEMIKRRDAASIAQRNARARNRRARQMPTTVKDVFSARQKELKKVVAKHGVKRSVKGMVSIGSAAQRDLIEMEADR